ncbi:hypothetical protein [Promicromonospora sp. NPDC057488]|uniref:hypothetical protein n=1 Tax=Promicromonospora sp. NPDC057488 TaxID=3346147 RepID=UPI003670DC59
MGRWLRNMTVVVAVTVGLVGAGTGAYALQKWGTINAMDGNTRLGSAYGTAYFDDSTGDRWYFKSHYTDRRDNGNGVYTNTAWYFNGSYCYPAGEGSVGCTAGWYGDGATNTAVTSASRTGYSGKALKGTAESIRGGIRVCQSDAFADTCSHRTFRGMSYRN